MFKKSTNLWRVIAILGLLFALVCVACELEGTGQEGQIRVSDIIDAKVPLITVQPQVGLALTVGGPATPLTVTAEAQETDGELSFELFTYTDPADYVNDAGTLVAVAPSITGTTAKTASFSPPVGADGVFYYYVKVTNFLARANGVQTASVNSEPSIVTVSDPNAAEYPAITALTGGGYYIATPSPTVILEVTASATGDGLSYKWFSSEGPAVKDGTEIGSASGETYTLPIVTPGTYYYYVEVTNTDAGKSGRKTSTVTSPFTVNIVATNAAVTVNTATKYQYVRGFGGMYTPWDNAPQESLEDFERMFSPDGLGMNILRIMIKADSTDIEETMRLMTTGQDGDNKDQSIYYEIVKIVNKYGGYVLASPWSPPADWKTNNSVNGGGTLRPGNYKQFANYLKKFCQVMYDHGAPIYAVSHQNEPTFTAQNYEGCEYTTIQHRDWWEQAGGTVVGGEVRPFTYGVPGYGGGKAIPRVLTMTGEAHNNVSPYHTDSTSALQTPEARQFIDIVGRHIYGAGINPIPFDASAGPDGPGASRWGREVWMTEHNINSGEGSYHQDSTWNYVWKFLNDVDLVIRLNSENAFVWWTAKRFYSFIGDGWNNSGTTNGTVLNRGYAMSHYAKFAKEMTRVAVTGSGTTATNVPINSSNFNNPTLSSTPAERGGIDTTDVKVTAFESADGKTISLVMYTPTDPTGGGGVDMGTVKIQLPANFTVGRAVAMRSNSESQAVTESVRICVDGKSAIVDLPASTILSVRFIKAE